MTSEGSDGKQTTKADKPWLFKKGQSGNPAGRPKGSVGLKTWAKEYLASMTEEERMDFMDGLPKEVIWRMAEGNPSNNTDLTTAGQPLQIVGMRIIKDGDPVQN